GRRLLLGLGRRQGRGTAAGARAALALVHPDLRVEDHVEVVSLVTDLLDGVVHAPGAGDRFVDRLTELLEHRAEMIGEFHDRSDYRFRFRKNTRIFPTRKKCYPSVSRRAGSSAAREVETRSLRLPVVPRITPFER